MRARTEKTTGVKAICRQTGPGKQSITSMVVDRRPGRNTLLDWNRLGADVGEGEKDDNLAGAFGRHNLAVADPDVDEDGR